MDLSICILTYNSSKTICDLLSRVSELNSEIIIVDSGSMDSTLSIIEEFDNIILESRPYACHSDQMNYATNLAKNDWVLCLDSDEIPNEEFIDQMKSISTIFGKDDIFKVGRIKRKWFVLGVPVHAMYPCSSPDYVVRLYNKTVCGFNDRKVDDKVIGFKEEIVLDGEVNHYTFETEEILNNKLKSYIGRTKKNKMFRKFLPRAIVSAIGAFIKWYFVKKAYLDGVVGFKTAWYAVRYSFYKYR